MVHMINLDRLLLSSSSGRFFVSVDSTASFKQSVVAGEKPQIAVRQEDLLSSTSWVSSGAFLRISVLVSWDGDLLLDTPSDVLQSELGEVLLTSALWHQLGFNPSLNLTPTHDYDSRIGPIILDLTPLAADQKTRHRSRRKATRILADRIPITDVQPPPGIDRYVFQSVFITMTLRAVAEKSILDGSIPEILAPDNLSSTGGDATVCPSSPLISEYGCPGTMDIDGYNEDSVTLRGSMNETIDLVMRGRLADLAPAVFMPSYLEDVAARSAFIPSISDTLSKVVSSVPIFSEVSDERDNVRAGLWRMICTAAKEKASQAAPSRPWTTNEERPQSTIDCFGADGDLFDIVMDDM